MQLKDYYKSLKVKTKDRLMHNILRKYMRLEMKEKPTRLKKILNYLQFRLEKVQKINWL